MSHGVGLMGRAKKICKELLTPVNDRENQGFFLEVFCWIGLQPVEARV